MSSDRPNRLRTGRREQVTWVNSRIWVLITIPWPQNHVENFEGFRRWESFCKSLVLTKINDAINFVTPVLPMDQ